ncbi:hypothetical protein JB92DRAFT_3102848 [Gautieria morchelliformis]|nr:hypothetical protein JB92DRAFT_3102848 [Gautieria morchelliformis]
MRMFFRTLAYLISPSNDTRISIAAILMNVAMSGFNPSQEATAPCLDNCAAALFSTNIAMSVSSASQGAMAFGLDNGEAAGVACYDNFVPHVSNQVPCDASPAINPGAFRGPTEHKLMQLYQIATAANLQQYIITVKSNGVRKCQCNYFQSGSPPCHFIGTRKQVQSHIRRIHLKEFTPFSGKYFVGRPEGIRHVTTKNQGNIYECGIW